MGNNTDFGEITGALANILAEKNRVYGDSYDESVSVWGKKAMGMRLEDKYNRIKYLLLHDESTENNESLLDNLLDISGYAVLGLRYLINHNEVSEDDLKKIKENANTFYDETYKRMTIEKQNEAQLKQQK